MAVPKRKTSKMRQRTRRAANRWHAPNLVNCNQCGSRTLAHVACPSCGYYGGKQVLTIDSI